MGTAIRMAGSSKGTAMARQAVPGKGQLLIFLGQES